MKKLLSIFLSLLVLTGLLTGCGASADKAAGTVNYAAMPMEEAAAMDNTTSQTLRGAEAGETTLPENRKWIVTMYVEAETEDLDAMTARLEEEIRSLEGYVEDQSVYNGSSYASRRYRYANLTIRIPAEKADAFTTAVGEFSNVVSKEKNLEDITLTYVSTESRMKALQTEETRLLELLAQAETMSDLLEIEARLTDVRYELESVTSQLRLYDNQVDYATIHLNISEVQEYTPAEDPTVWERITGGFTDSLEGIREGAVDVFVWVIANSPYLAIAAIAVFLAARFGKRLRRKHPKKEKEQ